MEQAGSSSGNFIDEDYGSEFEFDTQVGDKRKARKDLTFKPPPTKAFKPNRQTFHDLCAQEQGRAQQQAYRAMDAYTRHKKLVNDYILCYRGATEKLKKKTSHYKTDHDVIRENHRFLWEDEDTAETWGEQLAKKYYDRLFKEYCLCDLTRYKDKKVGMRWRTEKELIIGKGHFFCGNIHCDEKDGLNSWEVMFTYAERGEKRTALVKLRLCERCSDKLHYGYKGKAALKKKRQRKSESSKDQSSVNEDTLNASTAIEKGDEKKDAEESNLWKQPITEEIEPSKEDVFEEFLEDLFL